MKLKTKTITVYTSSDGSEHTDHLQAVMNDLKVMFKLAHGEEPFSAQEAATTLFNNRDQMLELFKSFNKINGQKASRNFEEPATE